jgi:hypothetical protein
MGRRELFHVLRCMGHVPLRLFLFLSVVIALATLTGCDTSLSEDHLSPAESADCPVTKPNGVGPPGERHAPNYFGNGKLFTGLYYPQLVAMHRNIQPNGWIGEKFWWWADSPGGGDLQISGRRLDGAAQPLRARTNPGWPETDFRGTGFWAVAILFPTPGCWEVTGALSRADDGAKAAKLTFVLDVVGLPAAR